MMTEVPIKQVCGDTVERQYDTDTPGESWLVFTSGRWLRINLNTGRLTAFAPPLK